MIAERGIACKVFADDLKLYSTISSSLDAIKLRLAISDVVNWSQIWELPLAKEKIRVMYIGKNNMKTDYLIGDHQISHANEVWDLGFLVTENLDFEKHCKEISAKAMRRVCNIFRCLSTSDLQILLRAYKVYVRPMLEYGTPIIAHTKPNLRNFWKGCKTVIPG